MSGSASSTTALASSEGREGKEKKRRAKGGSLSRSAPAGSSNQTSMKARKRRISSGKTSSGGEHPETSRPAPLVRSNAIADLGGPSTVDTPSRPGVLKRRALDAFGLSSRTTSSNRSAANYLPDEHCDEEENQRVIRRRIGPEWMPGAWVPAGRWEVQDGRVEAKGLDGGRKAKKSVRFVDPKQSVLDAVVDELWNGVSSVISWALGN
ncbi:hypothetical protein BKA70DRAFT_1245752 [Coprinopsis sp. MPI-PUGE-AT-0042]|nr:hypothetical protein BKA70DRAFT_1245752 [Coprinopsis sp. MPI-PUGE-AT-0042]